MTPEEKWKRLTKPKTAEDYGISLTEAELDTFPEGREVLAGMRQYTAALDDQCRMASQLGQAAGEYRDRVGVLRATRDNLEAAHKIRCTCTGFTLQYEGGCQCERGKAINAAKDLRAAVVAELSLNPQDR